MTETPIPSRDIWRQHRAFAVRVAISGSLSALWLAAPYIPWRDVVAVFDMPAQAQPATIRAQVAPLKTAVRQLKSGKWGITLQTDADVSRLQRGQSVTLTVR